MVLKERSITTREESIGGDGPKRTVATDGEESVLESLERTLKGEECREEKLSGNGGGKFLKSPILEVDR